MIKVTKQDLHLFYGQSCVYWGEDEDNDKFDYKKW